MAKDVVINIELDRKVERYLAQPVLLNDIREYAVKRSPDGMTELTVKLWVDNKRFDQEENRVTQG